MIRKKLPVELPQEKILVYWRWMQKSILQMGINKFICISLSKMLKKGAIHIIDLTLIIFALD